uniref:Putative cysteine proteinase n=1 Tax=Moniliophthora roreri TaxID=221103 RepID=A0A0W0FY53_MONRR
MLNVRKRPAPEPILPLDARKQPRTAFFNNRGENQSPSSDVGLLSRWKGIARDIVDLGRDTFTFLVQGDGHRKAREIPFRNSPSDPIFISSSPEPSSSSRASGSLSSTFSETPFTASSFSFPTLPSSSTSALASSPYLVPPPPFSSSRKRRKGSMGPPPVPPYDSSAYSVLSTSEASTSRRSTPRSAVERELRNLDLERKRGYKNREHIHAAQHKQAVQATRKEDFIEMQRELFRIEQRRGYRSDFNEFQGFLDYKSKLEQLSRKDIFLARSSNLSAFGDPTETSTSIPFIGKSSRTLRS